MLSTNICILLTFFTLNNWESYAVSLDWDILKGEFFSGFIYKDTNNVIIHPKIKLKQNQDFEICNFILISKDGKELPFLANLKPDKKTGEIVVTGPIKRQEYVIYIQAKACNKNQYSKEIKIVIKVSENEVPQWEEQNINTSVSDTVLIGTNVVRVKAYELGKAAGNSICDYKITAPIDAPFDVDGSGTIRTTNLLNARIHRSYVLQVSATDCWFPNPRNSSINVTINIIKGCANGWNGLYDQINYQSNSGIKRLGNFIKFRYCDKSIEQCQNQEVIALLTLKDPNTKICDMDSWSLRHQWRSCGIGQESVELLPSVDQFVREDHGTADASTGIYTFDGLKTHWEIPTNIIASDHFLGKNFTFSFWMMHEKSSEENVHKKEQILCNSDGNGKNRHHYSLFLHNCKLILLYRTEPSKESPSSSLSPAEWRFNTPEICDNNWHHYSLIVETVKVKSDIFTASSPSNYPVHQAKLFIDGAIFPYDNNNPEIIDDIPIHHMQQVHFTKLAVGACWHARSSSYIQHFKGHMAGMTILRGESESPSVLECINQCHERLAFTGINTMAAGTSISINSLMSSMVITAKNSNDVAKIIEQMGYINSRWNPSPGKRTIEVSTQIKCSNNINFNVSTERVLITVLSKDHRNSHTDNADNKEYALSIAGDEIVEIDSQNLVSKGIGLGQPVLPNVSITDVTNDDSGSLLLWGKPTVEGSRKQYRLKGVSTIESCLLHVHPPLNKYQEYLAFTNSVIEDLSDQGIYLNVTNSSLGLVIEGSQSVFIYRFVLQRINYFNSQLDKFQDKLLKLVCSKNSAHSISNELVVKLRLSERVKANLLTYKTSFYHSDHTIHQEGYVDHIDHEGKSEMAAFPVRPAVIKDVSETHVPIILSLCAVIIIIVAVLALLRVIRYRNQMFTYPFSRSAGGPWVRLKSNNLTFPFSRSSSLRDSQNKHIPVITQSCDMEWDNSELYTSSLMDDSIQITVNPLLEHEKTIQGLGVANGICVKGASLCHDDRSLDSLPDEYDGRSEDFRDVDDEMTVEEDCNSVMEDISDHVHLCHGGKSLTQNTLYANRGGWLSPVNLHQNSRYNMRKTSSK